MFTNQQLGTAVQEPNDNGPIFYSYFLVGANVILSLLMITLVVILFYPEVILIQMKKTETNTTDKKEFYDKEAYTAVARFLRTSIYNKSKSACKLFYNYACGAWSSKFSVSYAVAIANTIRTNMITWMNQHYEAKGKYASLIRLPYKYYQSCVTLYNKSDAELAKLSRTSMEMLLGPLGGYETRESFISLAIRLYKDGIRTFFRLWIDKDTYVLEFTSEFTDRWDEFRTDKVVMVLTRMESDAGKVEELSAYVDDMERIYEESVESYPKDEFFCNITEDILKDENFLAEFAAFRSIYRLFRAHYNTLSFKFSKTLLYFINVYYTSKSNAEALFMVQWSFLMEHYLNVFFFDRKMNRTVPEAYIAYCETMLMETFQNLLGGIYYIAIYEKHENLMIEVNETAENIRKVIAEAIGRAPVFSSDAQLAAQLRQKVNDITFQVGPTYTLQEIEEMLALYREHQDPFLYATYQHQSSSRLLKKDNLLLRVDSIYKSDPSPTVLISPATGVPPVFVSGGPLWYRYGMIGRTITPAILSQQFRDDFFSFMLNDTVPNITGELNQSFQCALKKFNYAPVKDPNSVKNKGQFEYPDFLADFTSGIFMYRALQAHRKLSPTYDTDHFDEDIFELTPDQLFFVVSCLNFCQTRDVQAARYPKPVDRDRCSVVFREVSAFAKAFDCKPGLYMNPKPENRCHVYGYHNT